MRTKEEIMDLITEIDNGTGAVNDKKDLEYLGNVKAVLQRVLKQLSAGQEVPETAFTGIGECDLDGLDENEIKELTDFINREFEGYFKIANYWALETAICNISDAWAWVQGYETTKHFLSCAYLNLK